MPILPPLARRIQPLRLAPKRAFSTSPPSWVQRLYYAGLLPGGQASSHLRPVPSELLPTSASGEDWLHLTHLEGGSSHALLVGHMGRANSQHLAAGAAPEGRDTVLAVGRSMLGALGKVEGAHGWTQPLTLPSNALVKGAAAGLGSSYALVRDLTRGKGDSLFVWGNNASGQLGLKRTEVPSSITTPVELPVPSSYQPQGRSRRGFSQVVAGLDHTLLLCSQIGRPNGGETQVYATGLNADGQLGRPEIQVTADEFAPVSFPLEDGETIISLAAGGDTSFAISSQGRVFGWGNNEYGQALGPEGVDQVRTPTDVTAQLQAAGIKGVKKVVVAGSAVAFLDTEQAVWTTGYGPLGRHMDQKDGKPAVVSSLTRLPTPLGPFSHLTSGTEYFASGSGSPHADPPLLVWGRDSPAGRLGLGATTGSEIDSPPPEVALTPRVPVKLGLWPEKVQVVDLACTLDTLWVLVEDESVPEHMS